MSEHTPGPWLFDVATDLVFATDPRGHFTVCEVRGWGHLIGKGHGALGLSDEEANRIFCANARLIAAAPDLLEMLKELLSADNEMLVWFVTTDSHACALKERALAIIAKAEGRA